MPHQSDSPHLSAVVRDEQDLASTDELKIYKDEGEEDEQRASENLSEDKLGLVTETEQANSRHIESDQRNYSDEETSSSSGKLCGKNNEYAKLRLRSFSLLLTSKHTQQHVGPEDNGDALITKSLFDDRNATLGLYMHGNNGDSLGHPPPAHMGIPTLYIDPKTGLPMYSFNNAAHAIYRPDFTPLPRFRDRTNGGGNDISCISPAGSRHRKPYIKKPLNAFMLFMKESRQKVIDECTLKESAAINQILGRKWHSLERSEQAKYYEMARKEKELHMQLYPGWSARDNYATRTKKKKVKRCTGDPCRTDACMTSVVGLDFSSTTGLSDNASCTNSRKCHTYYGTSEQHQWCNICRLDYGSTNENSLSSDSTAAPKPVRGETLNIIGRSDL